MATKDPQVGDVWESKDTRDINPRTGKNRRVRIIGIDGSVAMARNVTTGRVTKIRFETFHRSSQGFKLVSRGR